MGKNLKKFAILLLTVTPLFYFFNEFNKLVQKGDPINKSSAFNYLIIIGIALTLSALIVNTLTIKPEVKKLILLIFKTSLISYAAYLFLHTTGRYLSFASRTSDIPYFHYALVQLSHLKIPVVWDIPQRYVWADHFSPILILLVPLYWIAPHGTTLMVAESLIVFSGAIPLYKTAKYVLRSSALSLSLVTFYLTFGGLQMAYDYGFHEIVLLPPFFFWMYYFYKKKKNILYFLFLFLSLCVKEEVSLIIISWGVYLLLLRKNKIVSLFTLISGVGWYLLTFYLIFPYFTHGAGFGYWGQYQSSGHTDGLISIALNGLFHPAVFFKSMITPAYKIDTIFHTFSPVLFLPLLYPPSILLILPSLFEKLLSSDIAGANGFHYSVAITVVTLVACIETLQFLLNNKFWNKIISRQKLFWSIAIFYCAVVSSIVYGYYPLSPFMLSYENSHSLSDIELQTLNNAIASIPASASVSAHSILVAHIDKPMGKLVHGPKPNDTSDYIITDSKLPDYFLPGINPSEVLTKLVTDGKYKILINQNSVILLQRIKQ